MYCRAREKSHHSTWIALENVSWIEPKRANWFEILQTSSLLSSLDACTRGPEALCTNHFINRTRQQAHPSWEVIHYQINPDIILDVHVMLLQWFPHQRKDPFSPSCHQTVDPRTQHPLPSTVLHFWQMVLELQPTAIVPLALPGMLWQPRLCSNFSGWINHYNRSIQ